MIAQIGRIHLPSGIEQSALQALAALERTVSGVACSDLRNPNIQSFPIVCFVSSGFLVAKKGWFL